MAADQEDTDMFRPPLARGMRTLDRSIFRTTIPLKAARVYDNKNISKVRTQLERSGDALKQARLGSVHSDPDVERAKAGKKCVLLRPEVRPASEDDNNIIISANGHGGPHANDFLDSAIHWPHSRVVAELVEQQLVSIIDYNLHLDYSYWTYHDIISAILPADAQDEVPSGFSQVGHVAHLNLREAYLPYKDLIASILMDKVHGVRTVINKIDDVGEENEFRTFRYEVLAGPNDLNVTVSEENCDFKFDYSKVYWNPRLNTEHRRLVQSFKEGQAVCDVMAGIGPFAVPAGKKRVFVWANDLNPDGYASLADAVTRNKVGDYVKPFNSDGRSFIRTATAQLLDADHKVEIRKKMSRKEPKGGESEVLRTLVQPRTFQHYVMNLPASALTFVPNFIGLYPPDLRARLPAGTRMPVVHVYCFSTKDELDNDHQGAPNHDSTSKDGYHQPAGADGSSTDGAIDKICAEISEQLHTKMTPGVIEQGGVEVHDVRDVAPRKRMFCASFRLPEEVAFRSGR